MKLLDLTLADKKSLYCRSCLMLLIKPVVKMLMHGSMYFIVCVCVCVRASVCVCARTCVCVHVSFSGAHAFIPHCDCSWSSREQVVPVFCFVLYKLQILKQKKNTLCKMHKIPLTAGLDFICV